MKNFFRVCFLVAAFIGINAALFSQSDVFPNLAVNHQSNQGFINPISFSDSSISNNAGFINVPDFINDSISEFRVAVIDTNTFKSSVIGVLQILKSSNPLKIVSAIIAFSIWVFMVYFWFILWVWNKRKSHKARDERVHRLTRMIQLYLAISIGIYTKFKNYAGLSSKWFTGFPINYTVNRSYATMVRNFVEFRKRFKMDRTPNFSRLHNIIFSTLKIRKCALIGGFLLVLVSGFSQGTRLSQLERVDTIQNDAQNTRYMPITLFNGEPNHLGQTMTVDGTQGYQTIDSIARHLPLMDFKGQWLSTCYEQFDVVVDGCWTMVADTFTCERAGPIEDGLATYTFPDDHVFAVASDPSFIKYGQKYTFLSPGWIREIRVNVPDLSPSISYRFVIADITDPNVPVIKVFDNPDLIVDDWAILDLGNYIVRSNGVMLFYAEALNEASSSTINGQWVYEGTSQGAAPTSQRWNQTNQSNLLRVSVTDWLGANRQAELLSILPGAVGTFTQQAVPGRTNRYEVQQAPTLNGGHVEFVVLNLGSTDGGVQVGQLCDIEWLVPVAALTEYPVTAGYWTANQPTWATVEGVLEFDGVDQGATLDGFGVDLQFQKGIVPEQWSLLAYSCSGGSGGISGGAGDGNGMFDFNNNNGTWAVNNYSYASGETFGTQTTNTLVGLGLNTANHNFKFNAINTFGSIFAITDNTGNKFQFSSLQGQALINSEVDAIEFQPGGVNDVVLFRTTESEFNVNVELNKDLIDIGNTAGVAGEVLTSNGVGLGVSWAAGGGGGDVNSDTSVVGMSLTGTVLHLQMQDNVNQVALADYTQDLATVNANLWETDAVGIIPSNAVDEIGIGVNAVNNYSIATTKPIWIGYNTLGNEMLLLRSTNLNDIFIEYDGGTERFSVGLDQSINRFTISTGGNLASPRFSIDNSGILYASAYGATGPTGNEAGLLSHSASGVIHHVGIGTTGQVLTMLDADSFTWTTPSTGGGDPDQTLSFSDPTLTISGTGGNATDLSQLRINVLEDGLSTVPNAQSMNFMTGLDVASGGSDAASIYLNFNEFPTVTTLVGNELIPFYDPNFVNERKITADNLAAFVGGGGGGDGIYGGSGTVPASTVANIPNGITFANLTPNSDATFTLDSDWGDAILSITGQAFSINSSVGNIRSSTPWNFSGSDVGLGSTTEFKMPVGGAGTQDVDVLVSGGPGSSPYWGSPAVLAATSIDPTQISSGTIDFTLPDITEVGEVYIYENNSGGGPAEDIFTHSSDQIGTGAFGGSVSITNDNAIMFIAVSLSRWRQF